MVAICAVRRVIWRGTASPKVTVDNPVLEAVGRMKRVGPEHRSKDASSVGNLNILEGSASRGRQYHKKIQIKIRKSYKNHNSQKMKFGSKRSNGKY